MDKELLEVVASLLKMKIEDVELHSKKVPNSDAYYFWNPARGGNSVIISPNGEKLSATSSVNFEMHVKAFISGRRN